MAGEWQAKVREVERELSEVLGREMQNAKKQQGECMRALSEAALDLSKVVLRALPESDVSAVQAAEHSWNSALVEDAFLTNTSIFYSSAVVEKFGPPTVLRFCHRTWVTCKGSVQRDWVVLYASIGRDPTGVVLFRQHAIDGVMKLSPDALGALVDPAALPGVLISPQSPTGFTPWEQMY